MCLQCCTKAIRYEDSPLPGWSLMRATKDYFDDWKKDQWGLVHCNDPDVVWDATPVIDPAFGLSDEEADKLPEGACDAFIAGVSVFWQELYVRPEVGHKMIEAAKNVGYDPKEVRFDAWLFHRMAEVIRDSKVIDDYANARNVDGLVADPDETKESEQ